MRLSVELTAPKTPKMLPWEEISHFVTPGLGGLLTLVVLLILTGKLVPVSSLRREIAAERRRTEDALTLLKLSQERSDKLTTSLQEMLPYVRNSDSVLQELRRHIERGPQ